MVRAFAALFVATLFVVLVGLPAALLSFIYAPRWAMTWTSLIWAWAVLKAGGVRLRMEGAEHLTDKSSKFFVANHQSAFDIPVLIAALRGRVCFLAKDSLFRIPIFGWMLPRFGNVPIRRSQPRATLHALEQMIHRLRRHPLSVAVFPEGTRSPDGTLLPFRKGTLKICQRAGLGVVPVVIDGSLTVHRRARFHVSPSSVRVVFTEPIPASEVSAMTATQLHDRVREAIARELGQPRAAATPTDDAMLISTEGASRGQRHDSII